MNRPDSNRIYLGDSLTTMKTWPENLLKAGQSVEFATIRPQCVHLGNRIGMRLRSPGVHHCAPSGFLSAWDGNCFFMSPYIIEPKEKFRLIAFHDQERKQFPDDCQGRLVARLITEKWPPVNAARFFLIIPSPESTREKTDSSFVYHPDLYSSVESRGFPSLALVGFRLLDSNISFPVNDPGKIGQFNIPVHITTPYIGTMIPKGGGDCQ